MKDDKTVIEEFNNIVNMTAAELKKWLKTSDSCSVGWPKDDGSRESIGHESGRKIIEILESNPTKEAGKYSDEQIQHMRKVVSYCKRHLAQEERINDTKSTQEVKKTKSYASLMNWGHNPLKKRESSHQVSGTKPSRKRRKPPVGASEGQDKRRKTKEKGSSSEHKSDENSPNPKNEDEDLLDSGPPAATSHRLRA